MLVVILPPHETLIKTADTGQGTVQEAVINSGRPGQSYPASNKWSTMKCHMQYLRDHGALSMFSGHLRFLHFDIVIVVPHETSK